MVTGKTVDEKVEETIPLLLETITTEAIGILMMTKITGGNPTKLPEPLAGFL